MSEIKLELPKTASEQPEANEMIARTDVLNEVGETMQQIAQLSPDEQRQIEDFAQQIDLHDSTIVMRYGEAAQEKPAHLANKILQTAMRRDTEAIYVRAKRIASLIQEFDGQTVKKAKQQQTSQFSVALRAQDYGVEMLRKQYQQMTIEIGEIEKDLLGKRAALLVDIKELDRLYAEILQIYKELTMYILAGKQELDRVRREDSQREPEQGVMRAALQAMGNRSDLFEKRIEELELNRSICPHTAMQIRLMEQASQQLARMIQENLLNVIPLWKEQVATALGLGQTGDIPDRRRCVNYQAIKTCNMKLLRASQDIASTETLNHVGSQNSESILRQSLADADHATY